MASFFELARDILPALLQGTSVTLELTFICISGGFVLGLIVALGRVYGNRPIYALVTGYVELIRGTPLLVQLFLIYYGLPDIGIVFHPILAAGIALGMNTSAYQAEYFRGAIQSIPAGQMIAARSLGMGKLASVWYIIIPQALRLAIPPWSNELVYMLKNTSLAYIVGVPELMAHANMIAARNFLYFNVYLIVAIIYLVIVNFFASFLSLVEKRVKIPGLDMKE